MSSPLKFPISDPAEQEEENAGATTPTATPTQEPLFLPGTPSTVMATPTRPRHRDVSAAPSSPSAMSGIMAKRAVGLSTPRRKQPLFARKLPSERLANQIDRACFAAGSSSPMAFPSSSPRRNPTTPRRARVGDSDVMGPPGSARDSEPLDFPS